MATNEHLTINNGLINMELKLFYSWQSDTIEKYNRNFIEDCLKTAIRRIHTQKNIRYKILFDKDIKGRSGSPDIAHEIFSKISNSHIFIADITIINSKNRNEKFTPNPNVLAELGFACGKLGWENTILICNEGYRKRADLPFDVRNRKIIGYSYNNLSTKKEVKEKLIAQLQSDIISIANNPEIFNKQFITHLFAYISNKLHDLRMELMGFIDTAYKCLNIKKPDSITITEFQNFCKGINGKLPIVSNSFGTTYLKKYPSWYDYILALIKSCQESIKEILIFANHLDIEFLGLFSQIDSILSRAIRTLHLFRNRPDISSYGFQIFNAIEFTMAANDFFSSKYGSLTKVAMDNFRVTRMKYSNVALEK
jgi:hypothetical protein